MIRKTLTSIILATSLAFGAACTQDYPIGRSNPQLDPNVPPIAADAGSLDLGGYRPGEPDVSDIEDPGRSDAGRTDATDADFREIPFPFQDDNCKDLEIVDAPSNEETRVDVGEAEIGNTTVYEGTTLYFPINGFDIRFEIDKIRPNYLTGDLSIDRLHLNDQLIRMGEPYRVYFQGDGEEDLILRFNRYNFDQGSGDFSIDRCFYHI